MTVVGIFMGDPATFSFLLRAWRYTSFPVVVLLRQPERIFLTTEYLDWYEGHMGVTQIEILGRHEALPGLVDRLKSHAFKLKPRHGYKNCS